MYCLYTFIMELVPASRFKRVIAIIIDHLILLVFIACFIGLVMALSLSRNFYWLLLPIIALYFPFFESSKYRATPGKMLLSIYVTTTEGKTLSLFKALFRLIVYSLVRASVILFFICCISYFCTKRRQGFHDFVTSTMVCKK